MSEAIKQAFPELFKQDGNVRKRPPTKYICPDGHAFDKTRAITIDGVTFGRMICPKCNKKGERRTAYGVWRRFSEEQVEVEEFILDLVAEIGEIEKEELLEKIKGHFGSGYNTKALGFLVYFDYLNVDEALRDEGNIVRYSLNREKDRDKRYEYIW